MVIVRTSRLSHPTVSCRHADRPGADPTWNEYELRPRPAPRSLARPGPCSGDLRGGAEDVGTERTCLHCGAAASGETQRTVEGPASFGCAQALRGGVHRRPPAGEPPPRVRDQGPGANDDTQQIAGRSALPAPHTG